VVKKYQNEKGGEKKSEFDVAWEGDTSVGFGVGELAEGVAGDGPCFVCLIPYYYIIIIIFPLYIACLYIHEDILGW